MAMGEEIGKTGLVTLVGAGPGDPELVTRAGVAELARADVVVYDGLANAQLLQWAKPGAEFVYAGKKRAVGGASLSQQEINELLVHRARAGARVVRLKGGDPFVFGRGAEECEALRAAGIAFSIVPGVTSATGALAYAGIPLTARAAASTVAFVTGHEAFSKDGPAIRWEAIAGVDTVVLFMAVASAAACCERLIAAGRDPDTAAAAVYRGTLPTQVTVVSTLAKLPEAIAAASMSPPALLVVGAAVDLCRDLRWFDTRPLFARRIVALRDRARCAPLANALVDTGAELTCVPVTTTLPPDDVTALDRVIGSGDSFEWVGFASVNGVRGLCERLFSLGRDVRAFSNSRFACVGERTAQELRHYGVLADVVAVCSDAEGLAQAIIDGNGDGPRSRVFLPGAAEGRGASARALRKAGFAVETAAAYRTGIAENTPWLTRILEDIRAGAIDSLLFFAPSQVRALRGLLEQDVATTLASCACVAAIGDTTAAALRVAGVRVDVVPTRPDQQELAHAVCSFLASSGKKAR